MGVPNPPKRQDRKALHYLETLARELLTDPRVPVRDAADAELYARALVIVALFGEAERQLFQEVYVSHTEGECLYELRSACACEGKDQLCLILDQIMVETGEPSILTAAMMQVIRDESWRPVQQALQAQGFTANNFVWWAFDPEAEA